MSENLNVALDGAGAFGLKHLDGINRIDNVNVVSLIGRQLASTTVLTNLY